MPLSYSFHISGKGHSITSANKLASVGKHNLRKYKSADYDENLIVSLRGSADLVADVKEIYQQEFEPSLKKYNEKQTREDRKIKNYFKHVCDNSKSDVAVEIIVQVGHKEFWEDKTLDQKKKMDYIFKDQLKGLEKLLPDFKIANATVHYDESSPHLHIVGVPVRSGCKIGLENQVAKTSVFTKDSLSMLQDKMRERAEKGMAINRDVFEDPSIKEKTKGRKFNLSKELYVLKKETETERLVLENILSDIAEAKSSLEKIKGEEITTKNNLKALKSELEVVEKNLEVSEKSLGRMNDIKAFFTDFLSHFKKEEKDTSQMSSIEKAIYNEGQKYQKTIPGATPTKTITMVEQAQKNLNSLKDTPNQSMDFNRGRGR